MITHNEGITSNSYSWPYVQSVWTFFSRLSRDYLTVMSLFLEKCYFQQVRSFISLKFISPLKTHARSHFRSGLILRNKPEKFLKIFLEFRKRFQKIFRNFLRIYLNDHLYVHNDLNLPASVFQKIQVRKNRVGKTSKFYNELCCIACLNFILS